MSDEIDVIVDAQLSGGEMANRQRAVNLSNTNCLVCGLMWHGLPNSNCVSEFGDDDAIRAIRKQLSDAKSSTTTSDDQRVHVTLQKVRSIAEFISTTLGVHCD